MEFHTLTFDQLKPLACAITVSMGLMVVPACTTVRIRVPAGPHGNVLRATLDNGLRVVIVRNTLAPMVTTQITYMAGGYQTPREYPGTAHALEHMLFRDSKGMSGSQLSEITGKMGADNNAFTTNDATQYYFVTPASYLDIPLNIEATRMRGALLSEKDWRLERGAIEQEVSRDISNPDYLAYEKAQRVLYAGTGYEEGPLGTRPSFDKTSSAVLRRFYDDWYVPNNAILVIVGDVDLPSTLAKVRKLFGPIPRRSTPVRLAPKLHRFESKTITSTTPKGTGSVLFLYRMPGAATEDDASAKILMDVLNNARSDLSELAVQGKVLTADAWRQSFRYGGIGALEADFPKGADAAQIRSALDGVIAKLLEDGASKELVDVAKNAELSQFEFNKNSAVSQASAWSRALAWQGLNSPAQAEERLRDVTVHDVNRVAHKYLTPQQRVIVVLTPDPNGKRPPNSSGFGGSESFAANDNLDVPLPAWAAQSLARLDMPRWTLDPVAMKLDNGITLIVQPEAVSKTVTVVGHVDHNAGLQEPERQEGVGRLLSALFDYGSTDLDRSAFHKALDAIAAEESAGTNFSLAVPSEAFDRGMQLLAENELHPAHPQRAFDVQRTALARTLAGELQSPRYKMVRALRKGLLPAGDPQLREARPETVRNLTLSDAEDYFAKTYRPDLTTLVVVGDVTPDQARATVEKYFGAWRAVGPKPDVVPRSVPVNPPSHSVVRNSYSSQDRVLLGQMLELNLRNPDRYALSLGNDVLGGNGFASRLMADIRVHHGYAYGARSQLLFGRSRSTFYVEYGSDPDKARRVDGLINENLLKMQNAPITDVELTNARQYEIRSIPVGVSSVHRIARSLLRWSYQGEPLNQPMVAARYFLKLSAGQVQRAFKKYLRPQALVHVVQGPEPAKHN